MANVRVCKTDDGNIDPERTIAEVTRLVAAGATDLLARLPVRAPNAETEADVRAFVAAFRGATGRAVGE